MSSKSVMAQRRRGGGVIEQTQRKAEKGVITQSLRCLPLYCGNEQLEDVFLSEGMEGYTSESA